MTILAVTDIHGRLDHLGAIASELAAADLVLLVGDITNFGDRDAAQRIVGAFERHNPNLLAVMGNCDYPHVEEYLVENGMCLHRANKTIDDIAFVGLGGSLPCPVQTLNEWTEEQIADHLEAAVDGVPAGAEMVLVSHPPAFNTGVDRVGIDKHAGSKSLRAFIERRQPLICFSGHIHEARGEDSLGKTRLVNPGPFMNGGYAAAAIGPGVVRVEIRDTSDQ